jgi:hypothetical protein
MGRYAYLIGSSEFHSDSLINLRGPPNDVTQLESLLARPDRGDFTVRSFVNVSSDRLRRELFADINNRKPDDILLLYFSGHGLLDEDNELYFSCCDSEAGNVAGTSIQASTVLNRMQKSGCRERAVILDCCFSGAIGTMFSKSDVAQQSKARLNNIAESFGTSILTSSSDAQTSPDGETSPFTRAIVESIQSGNADYDTDGLITLSDLFNYTSTESTARGLPKPVCFNIAVTGQFYISQSGRTKLSAKRETLQRKLAKYVVEDRISASVYQFAMSRFEVDGGLSRETIKRLDPTFEAFVREDISIADFVEAIIAVKIKAQASVGASPGSVSRDFFGPWLPIDGEILGRCLIMFRSRAFWLRGLAIYAGLAGALLVAMGLFATFAEDPNKWTSASILFALGAGSLWVSWKAYRAFRRVPAEVRNHYVLPLPLLNTSAQTHKGLATSVATVLLGLLCALIGAIGTFIGILGLFEAPADGKWAALLILAVGSGFLVAAWQLLYERRAKRRKVSGE